MKKKREKVMGADQLREEYAKKEKSSEEIAKEYKTSPSTILRLMKAYNLEVRDESKRQLNYLKNNSPPRLGKKLSEESKNKIRIKARGRNVTKETRKKISKAHKKIVHNKEWNKKVSLALMGRPKTKEHIINIKKAKNNLIGKSIEEIYGKERADNLRKRYANKLEKNPAWKGGISFEEYGKSFDNTFKKRIRKRDQWVCMVCGIHKEELKRALDVHHINYNKKLAIPQNCISLCRGCHTKTNWNRNHWTKFFQSLLAERYNYNYNKLNEAVLTI